MTEKLRSIVAAGRCPLDEIPEHEGDRTHRVDTLVQVLSSSVGHRHFREARIEDLDMLEAAFDEVPGRRTDRISRDLAWERELLNDPNLVDLVVASIPDLLERETVAFHVDVARRPYVIEVENPLQQGTWSCDACSRCFEVGEAPHVWIGGRAGQTEEPDDNGFVPAFCVDCVADAVDRARAGANCPT